jgi:hypothetical protein
MRRVRIAAHVERGFVQAEPGELIGGAVALEVLRQRRAERLRV